jgi:hypothetical protein
MRRFVILATLIVALLTGLLAVASIYLLKAPFRPGYALFSLQEVVEQGAARLYPGEAAQADYFLGLASRRLFDLKTLAGSASESAGLVALDRALDQAEQAVAAVPQNQARPFQSRLVDLAGLVKSTWQPSMGARNRPGGMPPRGTDQRCSNWRLAQGA